MWLAKERFFLFNKQVKPNPPPEFASDPLFLEVMREAMAIQDRFAAEPIYAKTGKGYLKSAGVEELQKIKAGIKKKKSK